MKKGILYLILAVVCFTAAAIMHQIGSTSANLSELKDYWYVPLPLGAISLVVAIQHLNKKG